MTANPFDGEWLALFSFAVTVAVLWWRAWQARFAAELFAVLSRRPLPADSALDWFFLGWRQIVVFAVFLAVAPIAALVVIPTGWMVAFCQGASVIGGVRGCSMRQTFKEAVAEVFVWQRQNHVALLVLFAWVLFVFLNGYALVFVVTSLLKIATGVETVVTRSPWAVLMNSTVFVVVCFAVYAVVSPLAKAVYVLRHYYLRSRRSGLDIRDRLARLSERAGRRSLTLRLFGGVLFAGMLFSLAPPTGHSYIFSRMPKPKALTPMMAQYRRIKSELPSESLLLFRLGDFYELFFEDAQLGAEILEVALTKRGKVPMCGIPYHAAGAYLGKLLRAGKKVAVCDQVEEGRPGKLVRRKVTQILSPGAHFDESILQAAQNNYLAAVQRDGKVAAVGTVDLTTGEFGAAEVPIAHLPAELDRLLPAEIIFPESDADLSQNLSSGAWTLSGYEEWTFSLETAEHALKEHFGVASLDGFGFRGRPAVAGVCGALLHYLSHHLRRDLSHLKTPECREGGDHLILDKMTLKNLEVLEPLHRDAPPSASLFGALNETVTPMGARCLRQWISQPLARRDWILQRQEAVETWRKQPQRLEKMRLLLKEIKDLERTISRLSMGSGNARDLLVIKSGLDKMPGLKKILTESAKNTSQSSEVLLSIPNAAPNGGVLAELNQSINPLPELSEKIGRAIQDQPPATIKEGGMIRDGVDPRLDEWRNAGREGKNWIAELQRSEAERTGIPSLKVRFNSVFGYFIEITRSHLNKVPERYRRRQTIANSERFTTPELKKVEEKILGAEERARKLEYELFLQIREAAIQHLKPIQKTAAAIAQLDVLASFSETARLHDYCRPAIGEEGQLSIVEGRHPALERSLIGEPFVPNNAELGDEDPQIALITGPNMAGKSTFVRQVALLALLAHTGSFVPAKSARIDLLDRIFTRIGASDELARGQSTFMVEMSETANILNHATSQSLVVLDEVGRGTSTFDGLSLAWSIVEHLHNRIGAKTLFATHYHELTELSSKLKRLRNFRAVVKEWGDRVVFVRKIVPGGADKSYGIQVARLASIPKPVIERAKKILERLEQSDLQTDGQPNNQRLSQANRNALKNLETPPQLDLFSLPT